MFLSRLYQSAASKDTCIRSILRIQHGQLPLAERGSKLATVTLDKGSPERPSRARTVTSCDAVAVEVQLLQWEKRVMILALFKTTFDCQPVLVGRCWNLMDFVDGIKTAWRVSHCLYSSWMRKK